MKKKISICLVIMFTFVFALYGCKDNTEIGDKAETLEGLKGKIVYNIGEGNVPDLTFRYILKAKGLEYQTGTVASENKVTLAYVNDSSAAGAMLEAGKSNYVIAAEPSVSAIASSVKDSKILFDLQSEYNKASSTAGGFPQSCLIVKKAFLESNPDAVSAVSKALAESVEWASNNVEQAITALTAKGSATMKKLTKESATRSNVVFKNAYENKSFIEGYFNNIVSVAGDINPIGGALPSDAFYAQNYLTDAVSSDASFKIYAPDGSPCLALAKLIADGENSKIKNAQINIVPPASIGEQVLKNADMAIMPINAAANLFNKNKPIKIVAITTAGSLYMLTK